jgi:hypothetical protein
MPNPTPKTRPRYPMGLGSLYSKKCGRSVTPPCSSVVKNAWSLTSISIRVHGVVLWHGQFYLLPNINGAFETKIKLPLASRSVRLIRVKRAPDVYWVGCWVGPLNHQHIVVKRTTVSLSAIEPWSFSPQPTTL